MTSTVDLGRIGNQSYVSQNALGKLLQELKGKTITSGSRSAIKRARTKRIDAKTSFGSVIQCLHPTMKSGKADSIPYAHPWALMESCLADHPGFRRFFSSIRDREPGHRFSICLYSDEVTPGNVLAHDNKRRVQACYLPFFRMISRLRLLPI